MWAGQQGGVRTGSGDETTPAMAEGGGGLFSMSLQKLDDELTCPVCTDHFKEPKVLPCLHYYCKTCIANLIKRAKGSPFNCPECRREAQAAGNNPERCVSVDLLFFFECDGGGGERGGYHSVGRRSM